MLPSSSSSTNGSLHHPPLLSIVNSSAYIFCYISPPSSSIFIAVGLLSILLSLPICASVLLHALRKWQDMVTASDCFTYHVAALELVSVCGNCVALWGSYAEDQSLVVAGALLYGSTWYGHMLFHLLTCAEHLLAVVHPLTYRKLRPGQRVQLRSAGSACAWLLSCAAMALITTNDALVAVDFCMLVLSIAAVSYCSFSVYRVLARPGPGEHRSAVDPAKRRALNTILSLLGALLLRFCFNLAWLVVHLTKDDSNCIILMCGMLSNLPCSLALPLVYLHRQVGFCRGDVRPE